MSNKRRNRRTTRGPRYSAMGKAKARTKLAANVTEEHEWYMDTPDIRLTRIFTVVLLLHAVAFGGILAYKMVDKASANTSVAISSARPELKPALQEEREMAAEARPDSAARARKSLPPSPLRRDRGSDNQYKVQAGDTLPEIAAALQVDPAALRRVNSIISDNELYPGRWLRIPTEKDMVVTPSAPPAAEQPAQLRRPPVTMPEPPQSTRTQRVYQVRAGDTAWGIAQKLGVSYHDLMRVNGVDKPEKLQIGQKLRIP